MVSGKLRKSAHCGIFSGRQKTSVERTKGGKNMRPRKEKVSGLGVLKTSETRQLAPRTPQKMRTVGLPSTKIGRLRKKKKLPKGKKGVSGCVSL